MRKKRKQTKKGRRKNLARADNPLKAHEDLIHLKKTIESVWENIEKSQEKLEDLEIHLNLLTRLLTTLCIEKFGMRIGVLKRMIKRIEKEAIRDSQILHLEALYKLPPHSNKKGSSSQPPSKNDPWEEIS